MTIKYKNNLIDGVRFILFTIPRSRTYLILGLFFFLLQFYRTARITFYLDTPVWANTIVLIFSVLFWMLILFSLLILLNIIVLYFNKKFFYEKSIRLSDEGIQSLTKGAKSEFEWSYLSKVKATKKLILMYTDDQCAFIIPRDAFSSKDQADEFFNYASSQMQKLG